MKNIILIILLIIPTYSFALIDIKTMTYKKEWTDIPELHSIRQYERGFSGVFGKNWCSILDYKNPCKNYTIKKMSSELYKLSTLDETINLYIFDNKVKKIEKGNDFWIINYSPSGLVLEIVSRISSATYEYKDELLVSLKNGYNNSYKYEYKNKVLSKTIYPKEQKEEIVYNDKMEIIGFINSDNCQEFYEHSSGKESLVTKVCNGKEIVKNKFIFENNNLKKYISNSENEFKAVLYDTNCKKPIEIVRTNKDNDSKMLKYTYNKKCEVSKIEDLEKKKTISLEYKKQNINKITINNKDKMNLYYNKINKLEKITHSSLGKMEITYSKFNGKILEVYPTNTKLSLEFNNILSIIEPSFTD